ncbi:PVC-type heme-binding CxxCH protein [Catenovulum sediminis]|uniref:PVC-type heme-binding CxxCH protein n=1 Tax=Catenovulum sediminis TaxID=1740262 RepID=A0ABV1RCM3_9ALTE|nr:PVC-type heme-binding CxxCH protein [Catenovulum sediminis]
MPKKTNRKINTKIVNQSLISLSLILAFTGCANQAADNAPENAVDKQVKATQTKSEKANPGDREGHVMTEVVPRDMIPQAPILDSEQALASFKVHPEFELELIADSPLIYDPVVIQYDAAGRIWALEMTTFMPDAQANGEMQHESQIVVLTDTNQDGKMDDRQVIIEKLLLPRALAFVQEGILWADHESLYFTQIADHNGKISAVKTEVVDAEYAKGGNLEHKPNGLLFSLDNWYYNAKSSVKYRPYPLDAKLPEGATEIYRNPFWKFAKAHTEYRGQWGLAQDDYGRHYFNHNSSPILTSSFIPDVANRNPRYKFPKDVLNQNVGTTDVYPIRVTPGLNRGYNRGMYDDEFRLKAHTAACGPLIYRGNQFPGEYYGIGLVSEPAGNLVKATRIEEQNGLLTGENLFDKQEILASTDERFRPVNAYNAPDGTVTLVDFYHGIIQHRTFLTSYLHDQIKMRDLERSKHVGRLYRIKHKSSAIPKVQYLDKLSAIELVPFLAHDNGWHRDTAQHLLVMKQDKSVLPELRKMATSHPNHLAQIKALWTLEGLGVVELNILQTAALNKNAKVQRSVYRLAEQLNTSATLQDWLQQQAENTNAEAAQALSLAIGTHKAWPALTTLINKYGVNHFTFAALAHAEKAYLAAEGKNISTANKEKITLVMNIDPNKKHKKTLSGESLLSFGRGKNLYEGKAACFGCHGANGEGSAIVPPLNNSEWVTKSKDKLAAILLHGLSGPIEVNGQAYNSPMVMPGLAGNNQISDQDLADIATYIRNAWDNQAQAVKADDIKKMRAETKTQTIPYTAETLSAKFK